MRPSHYDVHLPHTRHQRVLQLRRPHSNHHKPYLQAPSGCLAEGLGSGLADLLGGWYNWVIFTTVIKGAEGYIAGHMAGDHYTRTIKKTVTAWLVGGAVMVGGYFIVQVFMYGFAAALSELPFNMVQMIVAGVVGLPISNALKDRLEL